MTKKDDLSTNNEITWCPGCGNFGILNAVKKSIQALDDQGLNKNDLVMTTGIGCHGKIFDYLSLNGLYSIHGRSVATGQGIKLGNPDLTVVIFAGDGDGYGEGLAHMIFAAKRNMDITVIVHNNGAYALTTGQFSPTSNKGFKGPSRPQGNIEPPINPLSLLLEAGASFVARGYAGNIDHLSKLIVEGVKHTGFSLIDILQPSVVFNDTYKEYNKKTKIVENPAESFDDAIHLVKSFENSIPIGVFYKKDKPVFHTELMGKWNPVKNKYSKKKRLESIEKLIE